MRYFFGPLLIVMGILMMRYTVQITGFTGRLDFAEKYLGKGTAAGTYTWWRLLGFAITALAAMWLFGMLDWFTTGFVGIFTPK